MVDLFKIPASTARVADDLIFVSGKMGLDANKKIVPGGMAAQTLAALNNIEDILKEHGCDRSNIIKTTIWITDKSLFEEYNKAYAEFFEGNTYPARATVVSGLVLDGGLVEIEAIAQR